MFKFIFKADDFWRWFRRTRRTIENPSPYLKEIGLHMVASIKRNFEVGGRPKRWKPLSKETIKRRRKGSSKPLVDTGRLKNSINFKITGRSVEIGPSGDIVYAAIHQFGGRAGRGHSAQIPARPYLVFQKEDINYIKEVMDEALRRAGR